MLAQISIVCFTSYENSHPDNPVAFFPKNLHVDAFHDALGQPDARGVPAMSEQIRYIVFHA
jgi:hypothetical protein